MNEEAIQAAVEGERTYLRPVERREAVRRLVDTGIDDEEICRRLRVSTRTVRRMKAQVAA
jgi:DNA-binding NarL/FixJ family response regulator